MNFNSEPESVTAESSELKRNKENGTFELNKALMRAPSEVGIMTQLLAMKFIFENS